MKPFTIGEIISATGGKLYAGDENITVTKVCQDSRLATEGSVFFAVRGYAFDGHNFVRAAIANGSKAVALEDIEAIVDVDVEGIAVIQVSDTVKALQDLSKKYLDSLDVKKIAVTGSVGKTSTRDMTYYVCSEKYKTQKNQGNFNTVVGVPLTIMEFDEDIEVAILEMGMDKPGEIDTMVDIVRPEIGIITNIGISHLENFENRDGIFHAKMEVTNYFDENSTLIVTESEDYLNRENLHGDYKIIFTGDSVEDEYVVSNIMETEDDDISFTVTCGDKEGDFVLPVPGRHNAFNATLAIAAGAQIGVTFDEAARGLAKMELTGKRLSIEEKEDIKVINDAYNASPASMKAALDILENTKGERHIAILGDMFELGKDEKKYHKEIGKIAKEKADVVITIGNLARHISEENHFDTVEAFNESMKGFFKEGDVVLIKASRGMALENTLDTIFNL